MLRGMLQDVTGCKKHSLWFCGVLLLSLFCIRQPDSSSSFKLLMLCSITAVFFGVSNVCDHILARKITSLENAVGQMERPAATTVRLYAYEYTITNTQ